MNGQKFIYKLRHSFEKYSVRQNQIFHVSRVCLSLQDICFVFDFLKPKSWFYQKRSVSEFIIHKNCLYFHLHINSNQIMKDRAHRKNIQRKLAYYTPSPYTKSLARYMQTTAKAIDPLLRSIANRSPHASLFPVYEFLRAASRLFLLQQMELLVMAYRLESKGWQVDDQLIVQGSDCMGELFSCPRERNEYRQVTLYILLVSYWSKTALNQDCSYLLDEVRRICHNFNSIFQEWTSSSKNNFTISPSILNRLYCILSSKSSLHYHFIVDQIVQLSHAYNSDRDHNQEKKRSYSICQRQSSSSFSDLQGFPTKKIKVEVNFANPCFNNIQQILKEEIKEESINIFGQGRLGQSQKLNRFFDQSYSASAHFPSIQYSHRPQMDLDYIQVGLCEGQSADLMVLNPVDLTLPSTILGNKGVSFLQSSMFGMREISIIQLKQQSELLQKQLRQKGTLLIEKK